MRDYEAVLKQARTCANRKYCDLGGNCEYYDLDVCCQGGEKDILKDAADAIEELLAAVPKWVSVEDEPPKEKGDYWCNVRSYNFDDTYYQHEVWFDGEFFVIDGAHTDRVTHWMPLPELPEEVE